MVSPTSTSHSFIDRQEVETTIGATTAVRKGIGKLNVHSDDGRGFKEQLHKSQVREPYLKFFVAGRDSICLLDTGCDRSMLPRRFVPLTPLFFYGR